MKAVAVFLALLVSFQCAAGYTGFIRTSSEKFVDDNCQEFVPLGMNTWLLLESVVGTLVDPPTNPFGLSPVDFTFSVAANNSQTTARVFAHGINSTVVLQPQQGVYNETVFKALDYIIYRAKHYGVRLILTLGDQWNTADSKINYLEWGNATTNTNLFFTSPAIQGYYQQHILTMLNRNNTYTGLLYKNDPTIFAWDLMNEVRCECFPVTLYPAYPTNAECLPSCADDLDAWVQIMANYTKTNDANHLVTIGYEGFWGEYDVDVQYNPGNGWAGITGQNFSRNMAHTEIDFAEIHYWPDEWFANQEDITYDASQFLTSWFTQHAIVANNLGKPLLLEEFGKAVNNSNSGNGVQANPKASDVAYIRDTYFSTVYALANQSMTSNTAPMDTLRGAMWWQWDMTYSPFVYDGGNLEVSYTDSTFQNVIEPSSAFILSQAQPTVAQCTKANQPATTTTTTATAGRRLMTA